MDEQNSEAGALSLTSVPYKDRSTGLIIFGILTILLGTLAGFCVVLMLVGPMGFHNSDTQMPASSIVPGVLIYLVLAVALIWMGIGSIHARRWARALLLIFSWSWLVMGVMTTGITTFAMPKMLAGASGANHSLPSSALVGVMVMMGFIFGIIFVIMPIIWTVFYQSRHVKATCEARDTTPRWTDACPLPVLALCLWLAFALPMLLALPLTGHLVIPFFGTFLTGLPGTLAFLILVAVWICAICLLYKLDVRGWWLILIAMVFSGISAVVTNARHDPNEMYRLMGYSAAQLQQIQQFSSFADHMVWISTFSMVPFIGYVLFIRKYMRSKA